MNLKTEESDLNLVVSWFVRSLNLNIHFPLVCLQHPCSAA